jgi:hypothetical protein
VTRNTNPLVDVRLEAAIYVQVIKALNASPNSGNYLVNAGKLAFEEALERHGLNLDGTAK